MVHPAAPQDANPLEGKCPDGGIVAGALCTMTFVERASPEGPVDRLGRPLDEGLSQKLGADEAPVNPVLLAAPFGDGCDADVLLNGCRAREPLSSFPEGG